MKKNKNLLSQRQFVQLLSKQTGYRTEDLLDVVRNMEYVLAQCFDHGYEVKLLQGLTLQIKTIKNRKIYDFETQEMKPLNDYRQLNVKVSQGFKDRIVNGGILYDDEL